ncbi:hypothetical protein PLICRDRAFT_34515 [Plicaturopsis crispa FD-325 SS-3]|nr:hypothetical protein PLICRDRAFT_34515 [Plicaturopsis crispa FD-325 SS-3]
MNPSYVSASEASAIFNVTAESLAGHCGVLDDGQADLPDEQKSFRLKRQLGILQRTPFPKQQKIHAELAAKHLPALVKAFRENDGALNSSASMVNVLTASAYFVRFSRMPESAGIVGLQAHRMATDPNVSSYSVDDIGEITQFLSTLFVLMGTFEVTDDDKKALLPRLKSWSRTYRGRLASEASDRCLGILTNDATMRGMCQEVKTMLELPLVACGASGCSRRVDDNGPELLKCARCKVAVYCGAAHQKAGWQTHKATCFPSSF